MEDEGPSLPYLLPASPALASADILSCSQVWVCIIFRDVPSSLLSRTLELSTPSLGNTFYYPAFKIQLTHPRGAPAGSPGRCRSLSESAPGLHVPAFLYLLHCNCHYFLQVVFSWQNQSSLEPGDISTQRDPVYYICLFSSPHKIKFSSFC